MYRRYVRSAVLLIALFIVATFAWACGGDEPLPPLPTSPPIDTGPPPTAEANRFAVGDHRLIDQKLDLLPSDAYPEEFTDAFETRPIVVLFYVPGSADDDLVYESLDALRGSFHKYEFLMYEYGAPELYEDLSTLLEVSYPPQIVLIDETGVVADVWTGYVDEGSLNQSLVNLRTNSAR